MSKDGSTRGRKQQGYALVAMMTLTTFASLMLFALAGLSVSLIRSQGAAREKGLALQSAEIGLDYARKMLTSSLRTGTKSSIEPTNGELEKITDLPPEFLVDTKVPTKVRIRIRNIGADDLNLLISSPYNAPDIKEASVFLPATSEEAQIVQYNPSYGFNWTDPSQSKKLTDSYFWLVEVTADRGVFSNSLRSMLCPIQKLSDDLPESPINQQNPFFPSTVVTNLGVQIGNPPNGSLFVMPAGPTSSWVETENGQSKFTAAIQTNGSASFTDSSSLVGDITISNPTDGAPTSVVNGKPLSVFGRISANSDVDLTNLKATNGPTVEWSSDNVYAAADLIAGNGTRQGTNQLPIEVNSSAPQSPYIPVQVPSAGDAAFFPAPRSDGTSTEVSLPPMNYRTNSLNTDQYSSKLVVNSPELSNGQPTRIFLDATSDAVAAIKIDSSKFENQGAPTDLQFFYAGTKPIFIDLTGSGIFNGVIYAPNATVTTSGTGDFTGAVVASQLNAHHVGSLQLDPAARKIAPAGLADDTSNDPGGGNSGTDSSNMKKPNGYKHVTWQQVSGSLVPAD
ncbi:MAG: hypothetical protein SGJ27_13610 [Candidatus Melainabacteria bacterium]|nr:hypothetical protein [Candidatus Melainabacteria bacterium]